MTLHLEFDDIVAEVGSHLTGRVSRSPDTDGVTTESRARAVRMVLRFRTEGRGDTDSRDVANQVFDLGSHGGLNASFALPVPATTPISYDGSLMRVIYEVEARVDIKLGRDPKITRLVLIVPEGGQSAYERPHPLPPQRTHS